MLHTKFHGNLPTGSGEDYFSRGFIKYGHCSHLGQVTKLLRIKFQCNYPLRLHLKFQLDRPSDFREEDL